MMLAVTGTGFAATVLARTTVTLSVKAPATTPVVVALGTVVLPPVWAIRRTARRWRSKFWFSVILRVNFVVLDHL